MLILPESVNLATKFPTDLCESITKASRNFFLILANSVQPNHMRLKFDGIFRMVDRPVPRPRSGHAKPLFQGRMGNSQLISMKSDSRVAGIVKVRVG